MARASWVFLATQLCAKCFQSINSSNVHIHSLQWSVSWCLLFGGGHWDREIESLSQCLTVCKRWQNWSSGSSGEVWTLIPQSLHPWFSAQQQERHQTLVRKADSWAPSRLPESETLGWSSETWDFSGPPGDCKWDPSPLWPRPQFYQNPALFVPLKPWTVACAKSKTFLQDSSPCPGKSSRIPWALRVSPFCASRGCSQSLAAS